MFASFWKITRLTWDTTKRVLLAQGRGPGQEGNDDDAAGEDNLEVVLPMGLAAQPEVIDGLEAICLEMGDEIVMLGLVNKQLAPFNPALESGETRAYGAKEQDAQTRYRGDGAVDINSKSGRVITLNGGTLKVARVTDPVRIGTVIATAGPYPVQFTFTAVDADGVPQAPVGPGTTLSLAGVLSSGGGADRVRA